MSKNFILMVKRLFKIILIIALILPVICLIVILFFRNYDSYPVRGCIAHGCGAIEGYNYTNSLEALNNAIDKGYKFIEIDLALTTDSVLVAVHDWLHFRKMCDLDSIDAPLPYNEFISQKIHGKYHPLSANMVDSIFAAHPETLLVTDKIDEADIILENFPNVKGRIITECFSDEAYARIKEAGIYPMRSRYINYDKSFSRGCPFVLSKRFYDNIRLTKLYKIETLLLNSRMNIYIVNGHADKSLADSLLEMDPYIEHVYIDDL